MPDATSALTLELLRSLEAPFYQRLEFWIATSLAMIGILFSLLAFVEARRAKAAALAAAANVKIQTIVLDLSEIVYGLGKIEAETLSYPTARDLIIHVTRKLNRFLGPYEKVPDFGKKIGEINKVLSDVKNQLEGLRPNPGQPNPDGTSIYYAIEGALSQLSGLVSALMGQMEHYSMEHSTYGR